MGSLCEECAWLRVVVTAKGSRFLLCRLSGSDAGYPKYPPQPVMACTGFRSGMSMPLDDEPGTDESAPG
ncbi:MAG: hypothetical protein FJ295_20170 [Planctomycetes bacterium]|nr:hypothetical protein [Planctomycetota bacterium]